MVPDFNKMKLTILYKDEKRKKEEKQKPKQKQKEKEKQKQKQKEIQKQKDMEKEKENKMKKERKLKKQKHKVKEAEKVKGSFEKKEAEKVKGSFEKKEAENEKEESEESKARQEKEEKQGEEDYEFLEEEKDTVIETDIKVQEKKPSRQPYPSLRPNPINLFKEKIIKDPKKNAVKKVPILNFLIEDSEGVCDCLNFVNKEDLSLFIKKVNSILQKFKYSTRQLQKKKINAKSELTKLILQKYVFMLYKNTLNFQKQNIKSFPLQEKSNRKLFICFGENNSPEYFAIGHNIVINNLKSLIYCRVKLI